MPCRLFIAGRAGLAIFESPIYIHLRYGREHTWPEDMQNHSPRRMLPQALLFTYISLSMSELMHQPFPDFSKKVYYPHTYLWPLSKNYGNKKEGRGERPKRKEVQLCGGSQIKEMIGRSTSLL